MRTANADILTMARKHLQTAVVLLAGLLLGYLASLGLPQGTTPTGYQPKLVTSVVV